MADKDIAPELLERIRADFRALLGDAKPAADTYAAAADYAELVGSALAEAFRRNLTADALPDGRLYWNIADRVVRPLLEEEHLLVADASAAVQQALNQQANLGIAPQRAVLPTDAVDDLLNKVSTAEQFADVDVEAKTGEIFEMLLGSNPYQDLKDAGYEFRPVTIGE